MLPHRKFLSTAEQTDLDGPIIALNKQLWHYYYHCVLMFNLQIDKLRPKAEEYRPRDREEECEHWVPEGRDEDWVPEGRDEDWVPEGRDDSSENSTHFVEEEEEVFNIPATLSFPPDKVDQVLDTIFFNVSLAQLEFKISY